MVMMPITIIIILYFYHGSKFLSTESLIQMQMLGRVIANGWPASDSLA